MFSIICSNFIERDAFKNSVSSVFIFAEINTKDEIYKSLKKYKKLDLLIDNSNQYKE